MIKKLSIRATPHQLKKIYEEVYKRDAGICQCCRGAVYQDYAYHHIIPRGRLVLDVVENLSLLHLMCHHHIHMAIGMSVDDFIELKKNQLGDYYYWRRVE